MNARLSFFLLTLIVISNCIACNGRSIPQGNNVIKTIQSKDGHTFDCINIYSQPALSHPLLKNHTIQMRPSMYSDDTDEGDSSLKFENDQIETINLVPCPQGTIPILRHNYDSSSLHPNFDSILSGADNITEGPEDDGRIYYTGYATEGTTYGAKSSVTIYEPEVQEKGNMHSGAMMYVIDKDSRNIVYAGWFVYPKVYGDHRAHFEIGWDDMTLKKDCINLNCPGFVQTSSEIPLGAVLSPVSTYNGPQYSMTMKIYQDRTTKNWWVAYGGQDKVIGYWPKEIVPNLADNADLTGWVGKTKNFQRVPSPPMGSGHDPSEGYGKAAFYSNILLVNDKGDLVQPDYSIVKTINTHDCYKLGPVMKGDTGMGFYFGGPGCDIF